MQRFVEQLTLGLLLVWRPFGCGAASIFDWRSWCSSFLVANQTLAWRRRTTPTALSDLSGTVSDLVFAHERGIGRGSSPGFEDSIDVFNDGLAANVVAARGVVQVFTF